MGVLRCQSPHVVAPVAVALTGPATEVRLHDEPVLVSLYELPDRPISGFAHPQILVVTGETDDSSQAN
jgi:hypothetical protein